ncbi:MAG: O-antigen ligase family protein [Acidimicrobiaceae bacterium]|nr:O-antigen ligase family protein [Acidimicrobiaceae bacterium]
MSRNIRATEDRLGWVATSGLGLVLIGGAVVFDPQGYNGYLASKVFVAGIGLLLCLVVVSRGPGLVVPVGIPLAFGFALGGFSVAATVFSDSVWRSVLGATQRQSGMLAWLGFAVAFVVGLSLLRRYGDSVFEPLMKAAAIAVIVVSVIGLAELAGWEIDPDLIEFRGRVRSTFGNPTALSGFLLLVTPIAAVAATRQDRWRWLGWFALAGSLVNIAAAQTRAVWLAGAVLAIVVVLVRLRGRARSLLIALVLCGLAGTAFTGRWQQVGADFGERLSIWRVGVSVLADNPLVGVGPEMFLVGFEEHVSDETARELGGGTAVDRVHNGILDFAVSYGAVAGALYVLVLVVAGWLAMRAIRSGDFFRLALGCGVVAYMLQQQAFFVHPTSDIVWWLLIGVLVADSGIVVSSLPRPANVVVSGLGVAVVAALIVNAGSVVRNDRLYADSFAAQSHSEAFNPLETAAGHRPFDDLSYRLMGHLLAQTPDISLVHYGIGRLREGTEQNPGNGLVARSLSDALLQGYRLTGDGSFASDSVVNLSLLIETQPANGNSFLKRGTALYYLGDVDAARSDWERAAFLMPDNPDPRNNLAVINEQ